MTFTRRQWWTVVLILLCCTIFGTLSVGAAKDLAGRVRTTVYQLDSGPLVHWWIEEETGMLCRYFLYDNMARAQDFQCDSLLVTSYNSVAQE